MSASPPLFVVLAAGKGIRMKSTVPKVLHKIAGRSMIAHVLCTAKNIQSGVVAVIVGPEMEDVASEARIAAPGAQVFIQHNQRGTADAVLAARSALEAHEGDVIVLYADTPLIRPETLERLRRALDKGASVAVLGFRPRDPTGYGRLLTDAKGTLLAIREEKDASEAERKIDLCNSGVLAFRVANISGLLSRIGNTNAKGEFYLTDVIELATADGLAVAAIECDEEEVLGVNARDQLATAEAVWQARARLASMRDGVTMIAPETVWLSYDTKLAPDVQIEPNVVFGPGVTVEEGAKILAFCHLEGAVIGKGARIGPFARIRPGAKLISVKAAAEEYGLPAALLYDLIKRGELPAVQPPNIRRIYIVRADLEQKLASWQVAAL